MYLQELSAARELVRDVEGSVRGRVERIREQFRIIDDRIFNLK